MRPIIAIVTIIGVINGFQLLAFAQGTENFEKRYEDSLIANHQRRSFPEDQQLERRFGIGLLFKGALKAGKAIATAIHNRKNRNKRSYDELLEERNQQLERRELERRFGIGLLFKGALKAGKAIATAIHNRKHRNRRSYDESLEKRDEQLERRFGIGLIFKGLVKAGKAIATAIHNRKHRHKRSYNELLEERDQLLELRDHLHGAHNYLAKRSDYDSLANDIVKRLVIQKRGLDYLLELNARDLEERDVAASISDLD